MNSLEHVEYRVARLQRLLAAGPFAELGLRVEFRGDVVLLSAVVTSPAAREHLLRAIAAELDGLDVHSDIALTDMAAPDHPEQVP
ncbi:hypothetical protein ACGFX4_09655 [Kitasatospora sp. NPDC048365]|uniref:hypothetical protein n=1 Tax=Kitasatospora sp. NPDC048365 TaxID=3364050 RepID=UPI0037209A4E